MRKVLRILLLVLVLVVLATQIALAASARAASGEMVIPDWAPFWAMVSASGGVIAITLLDLIMYFTPDNVDQVIYPMKMYLAMLFSALVPQGVALLLQRYPTVDPYQWAIAYAVGAYIVHEILYKLIQKPLEARNLKLLPPR
jgi:hypothetical protein